MSITARATRKPPKQSKPSEPVAEDMATDVALSLLADAIAATRAAVDRAEERAVAAEAAVAALRVTVEDQTGLIRQLTNGSASTASAIAGLGERLDREVGAITAAVESSIRELDTEFTAAVARAETAVGEIATDVADSARATAALVSTLTSKLPRSLIIDHAGDLVATLHNGDAVTVGPVRGPAGRDAPSVADIQVAHGHLRFKMSDGTSVLAAMPEPVTAPALPVAARTPAGDKVKDEIRMGIIMDRQTDSFAAIGKKYGVSARVVARIIKEFKA